MAVQAGAFRRMMSRARPHEPFGPSRRMASAGRPTCHLESARSWPRWPLPLHTPAGCASLFSFLADLFQAWRTTKQWLNHRRFGYWGSATCFNRTLTECRPLSTTSSRRSSPRSMVPHDHISVSPGLAIFAASNAHLVTPPRTLPRCSIRFIRSSRNAPRSAATPSDLERPTGDR
jgi:hypothetical protein